MGFWRWHEFKLSTLESCYFDILHLFEMGFSEHESPHGNVQLIMLFIHDLVLLSSIKIELAKDVEVSFVNFFSS